VTVKRVVERRELLERAADRVAGAGRVLHAEPGRVGAMLKCRRKRGDDPLEAGVEA
jgi:hypothetical protein